jgi:hypothetical protein
LGFGDLAIQSSKASLIHLQIERLNAIQNIKIAYQTPKITIKIPEMQNT